MSIQVPIEISARHVHLTHADVDALFGVGYQLQSFKPISQIGQFSTQEKIILEGPKGAIENVRIVGPERAYTQVELAMTDARTLGLTPPLRDSGDVGESAAIRLIGPHGSVEAPQGAIIQRRHVHADLDTAQNYKLADRQIISVRIGGERGVVFENVMVRVDEKFTFHFHLDTDEANAAGVKGGEMGEIETAS